MHAIFPLPFICALLCLAGCATTSTNPTSAYGNFIPGAQAVHEKQLASDAARQLPLLYPPASTRLELRQASIDGFGKELVDQLRSQGYALQEAPPIASTAAVAAVMSPTADTADITPGVPFNYVLDAINSPRLYRVTLILGNQSITRAYVPLSEAVHPAGAWVRKE